MSAVTGSVAYGLDTENSDIDRLGVYIADIHDILGLSGPDVVKNTYVSIDPDITMHEVGKFCSLAVKSNPTILELLWLQPEHLTVAGKMLSDFRHKFLGANNIRNAYGGYATQQARRLLDRHKDGKVGFNSDLQKRTAKHGRHCYRLLLQGEELLITEN